MLSRGLADTCATEACAGKKRKSLIIIIIIIIIIFIFIMSIIIIVIIIPLANLFTYSLNDLSVPIGLPVTYLRLDDPDTVLQRTRPSAKILNGRPPDTVLHMKRPWARNLNERPSRDCIT